MITLIEHPEQNLVEIHASGKLTRADYRDLLPRFEAMLASSPPVRCYVELHDFKGWEMAAFWDELKFDLKHRRELGRVAVVGDRRWEEWGTKMSGLFFPSEVRYFDQAHAVEARAWAGAPVAASGSEQTR